MAIPNEIFYDHYFSTCFGLGNLPDQSATGKAYHKLYGDLLPSDKRARVLDLGAGLGLLVAWLRSAGYANTVGVDPSAEQCAAALELYGTELLHTQDIPGFLASQQESFDVVFLTDVIEHVPKQEIPRYLAAILRCLRPAGMLILRTENMSSPIGSYQYRMDFTHEYCFTEASLRQVLRTVGFENVLVRGEPYVVGRSFRALKRACVRWVWWRVLQELYEAERPMTANPSIFSKNLIARCQRPATSS